MPQVELSQFVKSQLDKIIEEEEHKSYDSAVRSLLIISEGQLKRVENHIRLLDKLERRRTKLKKEITSLKPL